MAEKIFATPDELRNVDVDGQLFSIQDPYRPYENRSLMEYLGKSCGTIAAGLAQRDSVESFPDTRALHSLKRLKENGMWAPTLAEVEKRLATLTKAESYIGPVALSMMFFQFGTSFDGLNTGKVQLSDGLWLKGIEQTVFEADSSAFRTVDRMYFPVVRTNLCMLYMNMIQLGRQQALLDLVSYYRDSDQMIGQVRDNLDSIRAVVDDNQRLKDRLERQIAQQRERQDAFDEMKRQYEKRMLRLEHDVEALRSGQSVSDDETDDDFAIEEALSGDEVFEDGDETVDATLSELPEVGVLFVGGHWNMLKKMKELHPFWVYQAGNRALNPPQTTRYVFVWSRHLSHAEFDKLKANLRMNQFQDVQMFYVEGTNMSRLEQSMREQLTAYERKSV